jgi:hypothetical protein
MTHPLRDFAIPYFLRGTMSLKATKGGGMGFATRAAGHDRDAFNLGEAMSLEGLWSLVPLLAGWAVAAGALVFALRAARNDGPPV